MITHEVLATYKVNPKTIRQLMATELVGDDDQEEFEGEDAIQAMLYGGQVPGGYYDPNDAMSVE